MYPATGRRHWHESEDEFVYVIFGELVSLEEGGETLLRAGEAAGFKAAVADGHQLVNRSASDALCLEIGAQQPFSVDAHGAGISPAHHQHGGKDQSELPVQANAYVPLASSSP